MPKRQVFSEKGPWEDGEETAEMRVAFLSHLGHSSLLSVCTHV